MATKTPIENPAVEAVERTRSVMWSSQDGEPYGIEAKREILQIDANGAPVGYPQSGASVLRPYPRVEDETVDINGTTIAVRDIVEAQRQLIDRWRAEDIAPPPAP